MPKSPTVATRKSILELREDFIELKTSIRLTNKLLQESRSTRAYIHQFGVWLIGLAVIIGFYYNYLLLQPIWWTLFAVLFSYTVLSVLKSGVVYVLCWLLSSSSRPGGDADDEGSSFLADALILIFRILIPSGAGSSFYFGALFRAWVALLYKRHVYEGNPEIHDQLVKTVLSLAMLRLGLGVSRNVRKSLSRIGHYIRRTAGRLVLPRASGIASALVMFFSVVGFLVLLIWLVYGFAEECVLLYSIFTKYSSIIKSFISSLPGRVSFWEPASAAVRAWAQSLVSSEAVSPATRELLKYTYDLISLAKNKQSELFMEEQRRLLNECAGSLSLNEQSCELAKSTAMFARLSHATEAVLLMLEGQVDQLVKRPAVLLYALKEVLDFFQKREISDLSFIMSSELSKALWFLKDLVLHSGAWSVSALTGTSSLVSTLLGLVFDSFLQGAVYITALFLLLKSDVSVNNYTAVVLHFFDPSNALFNAVHSALRAILYSALKMAVFHGLFTWLVFQYFDFSVVVIPTVLAFLLGLVPVVTPVIVVMPVLGYLYFAGETMALGCTFALCFHVWWFVGPAIYAEIPDSSAWMTTFAVGFGIGLFGVRGVIVGPAIAVIPFTIYRMGVSYLKTSRGRFLIDLGDDSLWSQILGERSELFKTATDQTPIDYDCDADTMFQTVTRRRNII